MNFTLAPFCIGLIVTFTAFIFGFFIGVITESKHLMKWFDKELDLIEQRYKRKYEEDGDTDD